MRARISPSFMVAVLALAVAFSGVAYAGVLVGSKQIKDDSVQSVDIKDRTIIAQDIKKKSLPAGVLKRNCAPGERKTLGMCLRLASSGPSTYSEAMTDCDAHGGRLPTMGELRYVADIAGIVWANGQSNQYEFSSTFTTAGQINSIAIDQASNVFDVDPQQSMFWHHCLTLQ